MLLKFDRGLTRDVITTMASKTHAGMAHFAGSGPVGTTCRECVKWKAIGKNHLYYASSNKGGVLKPSICVKFRELTGKYGTAVPHSAKSCKYFDKSDKPPPVSMRK